MSLQTNVTDLATRIATECKSLRTLINGNAADLSSLTTTAKGNLLAAVNELQAEINAAAAMNDGVTATTSTWSSTKILAQINSAVAQGKADLVNGAPTALDTLNEIATALASDDTELAALTTALGNRVRFDAAQTLTAPQQAQARTNIAAADAAALSSLTTAVGDTTANFVNTFQAGLV
jgi:hypothetical protein